MGTQLLDGKNEDYFWKRIWVRVEKDLLNELRSCVTWEMTGGSFVANFVWRCK